MREERDSLTGDQIIGEPYTLWGSISGNVTAVGGSKLYVRGAIYGNLTVENGGRVHVYGHVQGNLTVMAGAKVVHSGILGGDAVNRGGRLYIDEIAQVLGVVRTVDGETNIEPGAKIAGQ